MKNYKNYINESSDIDLEKELEEIEKEYSDYYLERYVLLFLSKHNMFKTHINKVMSNIKNLTSYSIKILFNSDMKDDDLIFILSNIDKNLIGAFKFETYKIKEKSESFLLKLYNTDYRFFGIEKNFNPQDYYKSKDVINRLKIIKKINKIDDFLDSKHPKLLAAILQTTANDGRINNDYNKSEFVEMFHKVMKFITKPNDAGVFLIAYTTLMSKTKENQNLLISLMEDYPIFKKISKARKTSIIKKFNSYSDKETNAFRDFFNIKMTPLQYLKSISYLDKDNLDILIDLLKEQSEKKLKNDLINLFQNKALTRKDNEYIANKLIDDGLITKEIATRLLMIMMSYTYEYAYSGLNINISPLFQKFVDLGGDLLNAILWNFSGLASSYRRNTAASMGDDASKLYKDLINMVKIWDEFSLRIFNRESWLIDKLKTKYPEKYTQFLKELDPDDYPGLNDTNQKEFKKQFPEKYERYLRNKKANEFNL